MISNIIVDTLNNIESNIITTSSLYSHRYYPDWLQTHFIYKKHNRSLRNIKYLKMKDKDSQLIYEAYLKEDRLPGEEEIPGHDDDAEVYDEIRGPSKDEVADQVKAKFGMDIQWDEGTRKWWRLNDLTGEYAEVTGDEKMDIWSIEDNDSYMQHKAEGEGMRRQLGQAGHGSDEEVFPPENGRRY